MLYTDRIEKAINFIEHNLTKDIKLFDIAQEACFSLYHFHRIFHSITGCSIKEYIRKRRLSEAALEVLYGKSKVIDIAYKYRYETPETFSRAFKQQFGKSPRNYRLDQSNGHYFKSFTFNEYAFKKGDKSMEPEMKIIPEFKVVGYKINTTSTDGQNFKDIPEFWQKMLSDDCKRLHKIKDIINPNISYGICADMKDDGSFSYIIGFQVSSFENAEKSMHCETIPEAKYATFTAKGEMPGSIQNTVKYAYGEWLPKSSYELASTPDFELYDENRMKNPKTAECDIFIPVM